MVAVLEVPKQDWEKESHGANGIARAARDRAGLDRADARSEGPWKAALAEIVALNCLEHDWDGLGANAPRRELLVSALGLAYLLQQRATDPPSRVVASTAGTVIFEWQDPDGLYCEVEIDEPLHADVMLVAPGHPPRHWELPDA